MTWLFFFLFSFNEEGIEGLSCPCGMNVISLSVDATAFPRHVRIRDLVAGRGKDVGPEVPTSSSLIRALMSFSHAQPDGTRQRVPTYSK